jgi:periplasmic divalent cation tolerance protein
MTDKIVVLTTCDSEDKAAELARALVEKKVAACVNVLPGARSIYRWQDKLEDAPEWILLIKSRGDLFPALREAIAQMHSYEVPEVIALPVVDGSEAYLAWLDQSLLDRELT